MFDRDYTGGGQVIRFASAGRSGWLMPFHAEYWWNNPATEDGKCSSGPHGASKVECFYSSVGLAVSVDNGASFKIAGQVAQPAQPLSAFTRAGQIMPVGYGSLIVADAAGLDLDNPPPDTGAAYFYLFYTDRRPGLPGACARHVCAAVARAKYDQVVEAALADDPQRIAGVFRKYDAAAPNAWTQPATGGAADLSGAAGSFAPLWTDDGSAQLEVIYEGAFDVYLAAYQSRDGLRLRASRDLIHWSEPVGSPIQEPGRVLFYPTLIGDTADPAIAGPKPRLYFSSFPENGFPNWSGTTLEFVELTLSRAP